MLGLLHIYSQKHCNDEAMIAVNQEALAQLGRMIQHLLAMPEEDMIAEIFFTNAAHSEYLLVVRRDADEDIADFTLPYDD